MAPHRLVDLLDPPVHSDEYLEDDQGPNKTVGSESGWRSAFLGRSGPSSPRAKRPLRISALEGRDGIGANTMSVKKKWEMKINTDNGRGRDLNRTTEANETMN